MKYILNSLNYVIIRSALILSFLSLSACSQLWGSAALLATEQVSGLATSEVTQIALDTSTSSIASTSTPFIYPTVTSTPTITYTPIITKATSTVTNSTGTSLPPIIYYSQPGDSLSVVASHFGVNIIDIHSDVVIPEKGLIDPNTLLSIPSVLNIEMTPSIQIMPDSEVIFSPSAIDFDVYAYVAAAGGFLNNYSEWVTKTTSGVEVINRQALDNSINPRILLALLEYQSGWVTGQPSNLSDIDYPLGYKDFFHKELFNQYLLAVRDLSVGYYGWRSGKLTELEFAGGKKIRISPELNAGTVSILYYFSLKNNYSDWLAIIDPNLGFIKLYENMFGDPWARAQKVEPLFPPGLSQDPLYLPFSPGETWNLTSGPHAVWVKDGPLAALDFAPSADQKGCYVSESWVLAPASGQVVRSGNNVVILDLDNDGYEQTGWNLLFLHIATSDQVPNHTLLNIDERIGHPSCEGGYSTGTHFHIARKFNGEWILADGPIPFELSGWVAHAGEKPYEGTLTKDSRTIVALPNGSPITAIVREEGE